MLPQLLPSTSKTAIAAYAQKVLSELIEKGQAIQAAEVLSALELFVKEARADERLVNLVVSELERNSGKITAATGARLELCEVGTKYDYSRDEYWCKLFEHESMYKKTRIDREEYLKTIPAGKIVVAEHTGEVDAVGPSKSSKTSFKITLAK